MIVLSRSLVLSATPETLLNNPLIGWHNLVTAQNVTASSEADGFPVTNVANPITAPGARWKASSAAGQSIVIEVNSVDPIDYVAIARHNLGSADIPITIEGATFDEVEGEGESEGEGEADDYFELVEGRILPNDAPVIFRFDKQSLARIRISLGAGSEAANIAVIYVGELLVLQRRIYVGHVPIPYGRESRIVSGRSESGDFLGRIILSETLSTAVDMQNIDPNWYRENMDEFISASKGAPFFFAWRPQDYPNESGFAWMTNNPQPVNQRANGMMQIQLQMSGVAL